MPIDTKLVRDNIPELMKAEGERVEMYIADDSQYAAMLDKKLWEECQEAVANPDDMNELADLLEVIYTRARLKGSTPEQLEILRLKKLAEKGGFKKRQIVKFVK